MRCIRQGGLIGVTLLAAAGCATTKFESTWKDSTAPVGELTGKRVAAFVSTDDEALKRSGEDALARALTTHGVIGIPGYQLVGANETADEATLERKLKADKLDGMVRMRIIDTRRVVNYSGLYAAPYWGWGWGYGWAPVGYPGGLITNTIIRVETLVYSLPDHDLLWASVTNTTDPSKLDSMMNDVAKKVTGELKKQGLVVH